MSNTEDSNAINWEQYKQPIVLKCKNWDTIPEHYMFYKELKRLRDILDDFNKVAEDSKKNGQADECDAGKMFIQKEMSKVIAISGERGSGKTSLLKSLKNILEGEYHVFDIIGPEVLSSDLSIIDIFVSMLRDIVNSLDSECFSTCDLTKLNAQLKSITAAISVDKQKEDYFKNGHSDSSILESLNKRVHLDVLFGTFLEDLLAVLQINNTNLKDFVLIIDDLDLVKNQLIAKLLNDIQRYLDKKIIIIFAYRERQLENSLFEDLITDNQRLLELKVIDNGEVFSQINQFLLKLVPLGNRVALFSKKDLLNKDMQVILKSIDLGLDKELRICKVNNEKNQGLTVEEWFYKFIFIRTDLNIRPIDSRENTQLLLPQSLREIIQVAEIFSEMKPLKGDKGHTEFFQGLIENLSEFKQYIDYRITTEFSANLSMLNFFREWDSAKPYSKNYLTYSYIYNLSKNSKDINEDSNRDSYPFNLWNREEYNLTIGDVLAIIEEHKHLSDITHKSIDYYFFYLIKVNYSIYLSLKFYQFLKQSTSENEEVTHVITEYFKSREEYLKENSLEFDKNIEINYNKSFIKILDKIPDIMEYLQTINTNFMPQNFNYLSYKEERNVKDYTVSLISFKDFQAQIGIKAISSHNSIKINEKDYFDYLQNFVNSEWTVNSDVRRNIESGKAPFRYRNQYTYLPIFPPKKEEEYFFDFFINSTKLDYILQIAQNYLDKKMNKNYIYKNVFHTDLFLRRNYSSRDQKIRKDIFTKALRSINDILSGNDQFLDVTPLKTIIYNENEGSFYDKLYDVEKFGDIFNELILEEVLKMPDIHMYLKESLNYPPTLPSDYKKLASNLNNKVENFKMTSNEKNKYSKITKKIEDKHVTEKDLIELAEIYNKYII